MKSSEQRELEQELYKDGRYKHKVVKSKNKETRKRKWRDMRILDEEQY